MVGSEADADDGGQEVHQRLQARLLSLSLRTMALPIGRGAFVLRTVQLQPTEELQIPELCLSGRTPGRQAVIRLDLMSLQSGAGSKNTSQSEFMADKHKIRMLLSSVVLCYLPPLKVPGKK